VFPVAATASDLPVDLDLRADAPKAAINVAPWIRAKVGRGSPAAAAGRAAVAEVQATTDVRRVRVVALGTAWASVEVSGIERGQRRESVVVVTLTKTPKVRAASDGWHTVRVDRGLVPGQRLSALAGSPTSPPSGPGVGGDQNLGAIVGTGALLLPGSFDGDAAVRQDASACPDCEWRIRVNCSQGIDNLCGGALVGCPVGQVRFQILLRKPPAVDFAVVGTICLGAGQQLRTADQLAADVRDRFIELLPRARPTYQPASGALVNLPALFAVNEPTHLGPIDLSLSGYAIRLSADAQWRWDFGDGQLLITTQPGGAYPNRSVQHTYGRPGTRSAQVTSTWTGEFTVDGVGPYPVAGDPVELRAALSVTAREAGARLLSND